MKQCNNCKQFSEDNANFCPFCGGNSFQDGYAAETAPLETPPDASSDNVSQGNHTFLHSVKNDLQNSDSIRMVKTGVQNAVTKVKTADAKKKKQMKIAAIIAAAALIVILIISNIHICEECDKVYLGKQYTIRFWGETEDVCKECYNDYYAW